MIAFRRLDGPGGIPVFFQPMPAFVRSVSVQWLVFTGSADDRTVGEPGMYHWFEHVPFRGTHRYPDMQKVEQHIARFGGELNAYTSRTHTGYWAHVLRDDWQEAVMVTAELIGRPLLRPEHAEAERDVIRRELTRKLASAGGYSSHQLYPLLWGAHPLGHPVIGSFASLDAMEPGMLPLAHARGYDRSRCMVFISGALEEREVLNTIAEAAAALPDRGLRARRVPQRYGKLPAWPGGTAIEEPIPFSSSGALLLFPAPPTQHANAELFRVLLVTAMLETGGVASPLGRILREERRLVYDTGAAMHVYPDGGFWGLTAQTETSLIDQVRAAFLDVLRDGQLRSREWYECTRDALRSQVAMCSISPLSSTDIGVSRLVLYGRVLSDDEYLAGITGVSHEEVITFLDRLTPDQACSVVFRGSA